MIFQSLISKAWRTVTLVTLSCLAMAPAHSVLCDSDKSRLTKSHGEAAVTPLTKSNPIKSNERIRPLTWYLGNVRFGSKADLPSLPSDWHRRKGWHSALPL